ncbi:MAG: hypothetical protein QE269_03175 [Fimbriimonas sp.]|nr:hypothetical protein [Fimbriimonas sp.]
MILSLLALKVVRVTQLPSYPATPQPHPYALSGDGRVVVGQFAPGNAFVWRGSEISKFKPSPDQSVLDVYVQSTSQDGSIVVGKAKEAYRYNKAGGFQLLGKLEGDIDSFAYDVSADGSLVVGYSQADTFNRAFVWRKGKGMTEIPTPAENTSSIALAVSANGKVACGISTADTTTRAFRTDFRLSELLPMGRNHTDSAANDVSGDGSMIVGSVSGEASSNAVYWKNGQIFYLSNLGRDTAVAKCVSEDGVYIGGYCGNDAVLWHGKKVIRLDSVARGWTFESVNGIAHVGKRVIVTGWGNHHGKDVGYYLVMNE